MGHALSDLRPGDAEVIAGWVASPEELRAWAGPGVNWPVRPSDLAHWRAEPDVRPHVLLYEGDLVAYGEIWSDRQEREVELARLIVRPDMRSRGIGRCLVRSLLEVAASTGWPVAYIRVAPENAPALACYDRAGFTRVPADEQQRYNRGQPVEYLWLRIQLT
jgi:ribosomal protein S18 acetylase RimI-like enzyme